MQYLVIENPLSLYEQNFGRLIGLVPGLDVRNGCFDLVAEGRVPVRIEILEQTPYTTVLALSQSLAGGGPWLPAIRMRVRIYHDARLAEVIAYQGVQSFRPLYPYPNPRMLQPYEKRRVNQFLGEWLTHNLVQGYRMAGHFAGD